MSQAEFGWLLPTGKQRMPSGDESYLSHVSQVLLRIEDRFHSAWIPDHFMDGQRELPEAMVSLSFLAGVSPKLWLGTMVLGQSYRNPALLAKMGATLQQMSHGRFIMGIGAGWKEDEYQAYGYAYPKASVRIAQLAEAVQICKQMWDPAEAESTFLGQYYQIRNAVCQPKPVPPPPVMIGGGGEKLTLRVVARHADWWNLPGAPPEEYARKLKILESHCLAVGRRLADIRKTWTGVVSIASTPQRAAEQMQGYPIWPGDVPLLGTPEDVRDQLQQYIDLGVDLFILSFADEPSLDGLDLFLDTIIPSFSPR